MHWHLSPSDDATSGGREVRGVMAECLTISVTTDTIRIGGQAMDDLDRTIERRTARNPNFPKLLAAETKRLELIDSLVVLRKKNGLSQTDVALEMGVGQSVVAEIESGKIDVRYTTLDRYVSAVSREKARLMIGRVRAVGRA